MLLLTVRARPGISSQLVSEFIGSAGLLFAAITAIRLVAPGGPLAGAGSDTPHGRTLLVGLAVGGEVAAFGVTWLGRRSGGQLNPAVTLMMWMRGDLGGRTALAYGAVQLVGSGMGVGLARWVWGPIVDTNRVDYGLVQPRGGLGAIPTAVGEFAMTCVLLLCILAMGRLRPSIGPFVVFFSITVMIWLGGSWSGASFNPIRNFAPAVFSGEYRFQAVYLLVPLAAALAVGVASMVYPRRVLHGHHQSQKGAVHEQPSTDTLAEAAE
jgi:glycerol uptake facilitator-like aquaporin